MLIGEKINVKEIGFSLAQCYLTDEEMESSKGYIYIIVGDSPDEGLYPYLINTKKKLTKKELKEEFDYLQGKYPDDKLWLTVYRY